MIIVVGTINIKRSEAPIVRSLINKRKPTPNTRQKIAPTSKNVAKGSGTPCTTIELTKSLNLRSFGGIAIANVDARNNLPKKSIRFRAFNVILLKSQRKVSNKTESNLPARQSKDSKALYIKTHCVTILNKGRGL
tara:strand:+ start:1115 stop:1519 length:405 start_codon:yes stop_codon:yes gene_type:complete